MGNIIIYEGIKLTVIWGQTGNYVKH